MSESDFERIEGSSNVFRDLGVADADLSGFAAADLSHIRNADLRRFTLDRLMKILAILDGSLRVTLHVAERQNREAVG